MFSLANDIAIQIFNLIALLRGFSFKQVITEKEINDFETIYNENGFRLPGELHEMMQEYKKGSISFVAYYKNQPVGTVRLGNPKIKNRPFELHGIDKPGKHFEIQNLMVKKEFRDGAHFVMLGLFKAIYVYSVKNSIDSWISGSTWNVYKTMRRYSKEITIIEHESLNMHHPLTEYLYANKIVDFHYHMRVNDFNPVNIFKKFIKQFSKQISLAPGFIKIPVRN